MFWKVKQAALFLRLQPHQVYYLLVMGYIEAVKVGCSWRVVPEAVIEYDKRYNKGKDREAGNNFVYSGSRGFLFDSQPDCVAYDTAGGTAGIQGRGRPVVHNPRGHKNILFEKRKPIKQLELFSA